MPEVYAEAAEHNVFSELPTDPGVTDEMRGQIKHRAKAVLGRMSDVSERVAKMDAMGVDVQVLSASLVHQGLEWADAQNEPAARAHHQRLDRQGRRRKSDALRRARHAAAARAALAVAELERCLRELGLRGVALSTTAGTMELGDGALQPFWAKAEELDALVYIHPGGNRDRRFKRLHLWNSVGQAFEEAMAISSLV